MSDPRSRLLEATLACIGRFGMAKTTVEDVAREAGTSRASVYRHFPNGREQLLSECITWEVGRFFAGLAREVDLAPDFATRLEWGLQRAHRSIAEHVVLQKVLETEPERFLPHLSLTGPLVVAVISGYLQPFLEHEALRPGADPEAAADWLARMVLSFIMGQGSWDLRDPAAVRRLVRTQLLAGVLAEPPSAAD